jgi:hypothetical protein
MALGEKRLPSNGLSGLTGQFLPSLQLGLRRSHLCAGRTQGKGKTEQNQPTLNFYKLHHGIDLSWHL